MNNINKSNTINKSNNINKSNTIDKSKKKRRVNKEDKKIFYWRNNKTKEILAGGIFILQDGKILVQHINNTNKYEDIGGKTENFDETYFDTISREVFEEINGSLYYNKKSTKDKLKKIKKYLSAKQIKRLIKNNKLKSIYSKYSKYIILFINLPLKYKIDFSKSGNFEKKNNIKRKIKWISISEYIQLYNKKKFIFA